MKSEKQKMTANDVKNELRTYTDPERASLLQGFFKTGPGEYAEGDIFFGLRVPEIRIVAKQFIDISLSETESLLHSPIHEERLCALLLLVAKYRKGNEKAQKEIFSLYCKNTAFINNWDLVDVTCTHIVGAYLHEKDKSLLEQYAHSTNLWERRIAVISTMYFISKNEFDETLKIATILLHDKHDLIHKAVGWSLREIGKRDLKTEESFLKKQYKTMPRTMLRYAIERFEEGKRQQYLRGEI